MSIAATSVISQEYQALKSKLQAQIDNRKYLEDKINSLKRQVAESEKVEEKPEVND